MEQWRRILEKVSRYGELRNDRTGVGTLALFGEQLVFDNRTTFPAVTLKKLGFDQVKAELACFLRGYDNLEDFHKMGCTIWDGNSGSSYWAPRARFEGDLGRLYGTRWRAWRISDFRAQPAPQLRESLKATVLGIAHGKGSCRQDPLKRVWNNMLQRCYNPASQKYPRYGARGVFVVNKWLEFRAFAEDAAKLPGWSATTGCQGLQLDKDTRGDGFRYGPDSCCWLTAEANNPRARILWTVQRGGQEFSFTNVYQFCLEHDLEPSCFSRLLNKGKYRKSIKGFRLISAKPLGPTKPKHVDQLKDLVDGMRKEPHGRRHVVTCWEPSEDIETSLPPCHILFQAFVNKSSQVDLVVYMRSVDLFLGLPFDVASYAILQRLLAKELGLDSGMLTFFLGDAHIYLNHREQVAEVLQRTEKELPTLALAADASLFEFHPSQALLQGYEPHAFIKAALNV